MVQLGVIADDFTGACDVGVQFKKHGLDTLVLANLDALRGVRGFQAIVIDTESRNDSAQAARMKVRDAVRVLRKAGAKIAYKKIDSTLRGNIGAELDAVMDELKLRAVVVAPAYPATGRTTIDGRQLLNGIPLDSTEFADDPVSPVKESHIPVLIKRQTRRKVGIVNLPQVREGAEKLMYRIRSLIGDGKEIVVADAETREDLRIIAKSALDSDILPCGSAGLAEEVAYWLTLSRVEPRVLVVSGSAKTVTLNQICAAERVLNVKVLEPNLPEVLKGEEKRKAELDRLVEGAKNGTAGGRDIVVRLVRSKDRLFEIRQYGEHLGMDYPAILQEILSFLGEIFNAIIDECGITGLILVGGDTAISALNAIGAHGIVIEEEVLPGIPSGRILGGKFNGVLTITKAGAFGPEDALTQAVKKLREKLSAHPI